MTTDFELDMTMMYAVHDALRRDLQPVVQMTARSEGWDFFERFLQAHHVAEDDALWPVLRERLVGRHEDLTVLDEMAAEHDALGPLLEAIDDGLDRGSRRRSPEPTWPPGSTSTSYTRRRPPCP